MAPGLAIFVPGCLPQQLYKISRPMDTICPSVDTKCPPIRVKASCVPSANKQNRRMCRFQTRPPVPQTSESAVSQVSEPAWPPQTRPPTAPGSLPSKPFVTGGSIFTDKIPLIILILILISEPGRHCATLGLPLCFTALLCAWEAQLSTSSAPQPPQMAQCRLIKSSCFISGCSMSNTCVDGR